MLATSWLALRGGRSTSPRDPLATPGVDAVLQALAAPDAEPVDVSTALTLLAWEHAGDGAELAWLLREVEKLWEILESRDEAPLPLTVARHVVSNAWVDAVAADRGSPGIDALSGLHTAGYLIGRIHELDRLTDGETAPLVLLAVLWTEPESPWARFSDIFQIATALRELVRPEATTAQLGTNCAIALVPDDVHARLERGKLERKLTCDELNTRQIRVELITVPDERSRVTELIVRLRGGSMVGDTSGPNGRFHPPRNSLD